MMDQLVATVSQRAGISADKAKQAVDAVIAQLKAHLPATVSSHIDQLLAGNYQNSLADVEQSVKSKIESMLGR
jgi:hypothetical protein